MRKLKFTFSRVVFNQITYHIYCQLSNIHALYWMAAQDINSLEKLQNEAARIITDVTRSVLLDNLYNLNDIPCVKLSLKPLL